jgi:hypothetical protein
MVLVRPEKSLLTLTRKRCVRGRLPPVGRVLSKRDTRGDLAAGT